MVENGKGTAQAYTTAYTYDWLNNLTCVNQSGQYRVFTYETMGRLTWADNPETRVQAISSCTAGNTGIQYQYDNANNLTSKTDTGNFTTTYQPDALNRVKSKTTSNGTTTYTFDQDPGIPGEPNSPYVFQYNYLPAGVASETYPSGLTVATTYDAAGRPNGVTGYASGVTYTPHGALAAVTFANGVQESRSYNVQPQPTCLAAGRAGYRARTTTGTW